jgi:peptidoglycan DL-endopeptidase CwlO
MRRLILLMPAAGLAGIVGLLALAGGTGDATTTSAALTAIQEIEQQTMCLSIGPLTGLTDAQASNAEVIVAVANSASGGDPQAAQISLMTAITESSLNDDPGGMGGAVGLFQQTPPAWGSVTQLQNPEYAATAFVTRLVKVPGWTTLPPWQAAQAVQLSGAGQPRSPLNPHPGVLGGNYMSNWTAAAKVLGLVDGAATQVDCGGGIAGKTGPKHGLPPGYRAPVGTTRQAAQAINYAVSKLGDAYVWGAAGPDKFDCSGLTMMAWASGGVALDHYTVDQESEGVKVPAALMQPGDLVLIPGSDPPGPGLPGHVGIYLGDGLIESAIDVQDGVAVQSWQTFTSGGLDAVVDPQV